MFPPQKLVFSGKAIFPVFKPKIEGRKNSLRWIHILLRGGLHLELIHSGLGFGDIQLVAVLGRHSCSPFKSWANALAYLRVSKDRLSGIATVVLPGSGTICVKIGGKCWFCAVGWLDNLKIVWYTVVIQHKGHLNRRRRQGGRESAAQAALFADKKTHPRRGCVLFRFISRTDNRSASSETGRAVPSPET